jgi:hypothetical protein
LPAARHKILPCQVNFERHGTLWKAMGSHGSKQERGPMKRKGALGVSAGRRATPSANEEFTRRSRWDPYEMWRMRLKSSSRVKRDRKGGDPLR